MELKNIICVLLVCFQICFGQVYYVNINASPGGNGTLSAPFQTIASALSQVPTGATVIVLPGTYYEYTTVHAGILITKSVTIQSQNGPTSTTISYNASDPINSFSLVQFTGSGTVVVSGFRFRMNAANIQSTYPSDVLINPSASSTITLSNCYFGSLNSSITDTRVYSAITVSGSTQVVVNIDSCKFQNIGPSSYNGTNYNPVCLDGTSNYGVGGIQINNAQAQVIFNNSNFDQIRCGGIKISAASSVTIMGCAFHEIFGTAIWWSGGSSGSLSITDSSFFECSENINLRTNAGAVYCNNVPSSVTFSGNVFCGRSGTLSTRSYNSLNCGSSVIRSATIFGDQYPPGCFCGQPTFGRDSCGTCFGEGSCPSTTLYVNINATTGGNGSLASPFQSFMAAFTLATYGTTIVVYDGLYDLTGTGVITVPQGVTIQSHFRHGAVFNCDASTYFYFTYSWPTPDTVPADANPISLETSFSGVNFGTCTIRISSCSPLFVNCSMNATKAAQIGIIDVSNNGADNGGSMPVFEELWLTGTATTQAGLVRIYSLVAYDYTTFINSVFHGANNAAVTLGVGGNGGAEFSNCLFTQNSGTTASDIIATTSAILLDLTSNYFSSNSSTMISCVSGIILNQSNNIFCPPSGPLGAQCAGLITPSIGSAADFCGYCGGNNGSLGCDGVCFSDKVSAAGGGCCLQGNLDCNDYCFGNSTNDKFGTCCFSNLLAENDICCAQALDKNKNCCPSSFIDCYDVCYGSGYLDCNGTCNGTAVYDIYGTCCYPNQINCGKCYQSQNCTPPVTTSVTTSVTTALQTTVLQVTTEQIVTTNTLHTTEQSHISLASTSSFSLLLSIFLVFSTGILISFLI